MLETLHGYFVKELNQEKTQTTDDVRDTYQVLVDDYASELTNDDELDDACTDYIDELDILAYVHDISLPVLIGTRYRESHCGYYLPANGRGPMQITSHDYGTGAIDDHEDFITIMEDYIDFTNAKYDRYNRVTDSGEPITLDYTHISYDDIIKHGALYNGLSGSTIYGDIAPANPHYVFDNYDYTDDSDDDYKASRDGLLPITIKTAKWWLENR
ncbi:MAG: hypothetical protein H6766_06605 [Candidatus Peribacteria bacterium]|nr:MAG: hypothetical protein H6766_06605 [Candidatus Peribacteria bacterium]